MKYAMNETWYFVREDLVKRQEKGYSRGIGEGWCPSEDWGLGYHEGTSLIKESWFGSSGQPLTDKFLGDPLWKTENKCRRYRKRRSVTTSRDF